MSRHTYCLNKIKALKTSLIFHMQRYLIDRRDTVQTLLAMKNFKTNGATGQIINKMSNLLHPSHNLTKLSSLSINIVFKKVSK